MDIATIEALFFGQPAILAMVFGSVFLAALGGWLAVTERRELRRRLSAASHGAGQSSISVRRSRPLSGFWQFAEKLGSPMFKRAKSEDVSELQMRLIQAGYFNPRAMAVYFGARILLALILPAAVIFVGPQILASAPPSVFLFAGIVTCVLGYFIPVLFVSHRISKRQEEVRYSFPDSLDMLLVCVESGLGLDSAISRVAQEMGPAHPVLAEHFHWLSHELRIGRDRSSALRGLAERTGVDDVSSLVTLLLQTDQLGTSMSEALRSHAYEMRAARMLRAEEKAQRMPVKLSAIVVFLILPALMLFILSPAILTITGEVLGKMGGDLSISVEKAKQAAQ